MKFVPSLLSAIHLLNLGYTAQLVTCQMINTFERELNYRYISMFTKVPRVLAIRSIGKEFFMGTC